MKTYEELMEYDKVSLVNTILEYQRLMEVLNTRLDETGFLVGEK